jgi:nicotinamidase/pyrazinamidase
MTTVYFDVDTQIDFLYPAGALYVPGAEAIVPHIARLNRHAASTGCMVVSTVDAHLEDDPEFRDWPPHCVVHTAGQHKPASTLLDASHQIVFEKQTLDAFLHPGLPPLLQRLKADRYIVYGVVTEICVAHAARGLLKTGAQVDLVTDAVKSLNDANLQAFLAEFTAAGGRLTTLDTLISE